MTTAAALARAGARPAPPVLAARPVPPAGRLAAFAALALLVAVRWCGQVRPAATGAGWGMAFVATALGAAFLLAGRSGDRRVRGAAAVSAAGAAIVLVGLLSGMPLRVFAPGGWDELVSGIGDGLAAVPDLRVPYRGVDPWVRSVVLAGGGLLCCAAAVAACAPRRLGRPPVAAAALLAGGYAVPLVVHGPRHPFADGTLLAVLTAGLLLADRPGRGQGAAAALVVGGALLLAMVAAPRLDADRAWIDPRHVADGLGAGAGVRFDWSQRYGPLDWPRDGREMLRVTTPRPLYLKGSVLDAFDGRRWVQDGPPVSAAQDSELPARHRAWRRTVVVRAGAITSTELYAPGAVLRVDGLGRPTAPAAGATRAIVPGQPTLHAGDTYRVVAYAPDPTPEQMRRSGTDYPPLVFRHLLLRLAARPGDPVETVAVPAYGAPDRTPYVVTGPLAGGSGAAALRRAGLGRVAELADRLRRQARSPYGFVRRVLRRVQDGATYTETPPRVRRPLEDFLFGRREGFCQQFAGAAALLLRLGGVPARVATGFAPGAADGAGHQVIRDLDAHAWVEAYMPGIGWVTFDATPAAAPPVSQTSDLASNASTARPPDAGATAGDGPAADPGAPAAAGDTDGSHRWPWALAAALLAAVAVAVARRQRTPGRDRGLPRELAELRRALAPGGATTLAQLERRMASHPDAQAYVRALRLRRFASSGAPPPPGGRAALRRAVAGRGPRGVLRAWRALPPRPARGRR